MLLARNISDGIIVNFTNKNYKHLNQSMIQNSPHCPTHDPTKPSSRGQTHRDRALPLCYTLLTQSGEQQARVMSSLAWRQGTSMPVVKVVSYSPALPPSSPAGTRALQVWLQPIIKSVSDLHALEIGEAAYLIREFLLGIQSISIKYNCELDTSSAFFGINDRGQAKVWLSHNLMHDGNESVGKPINSPSRRVAACVEGLLSIVAPCVKPAQRPIFKKIEEKMTEQDTVTYSQAQTLLRKLCADYKIAIVNSLPVLGLTNGSKPKMQQQSRDKKYRKVVPTLKTVSIVPQNRASSIASYAVCSTSIDGQWQQREVAQPSSGYNSPVAFAPHFGHATATKPKVTWKYTNSANNQHILGRTAGVCGVGTAHNSIRKDPVQKYVLTNFQKQFFSCRSVPLQKCQRLNTQNKPSLAPQDQVVIKEFNPLEQEDSCQPVNQEICKIGQSQANTTNTRNEAQKQSKLQFGESMFMEALQCNKKSLATTSATNNSGRGKDSIQDFREKCYNVNRLEEMIDNSKTITNSIMMPSPVVTRRNPDSSRTTYDFGGLIPIQIGSKASQIEGKEVESLEASRDMKLRQEQARNSGQPGQPKIDFDLLGGIDLMAKFFGQDNQDLKESVWCGEEKRAQHLQIKLQKLGHFGRDISASFVPNE